VTVPSSESAGDVETIAMRYCREHAKEATRTFIGAIIAYDEDG
jgi:hypothetical protein